MRAARSSSYANEAAPPWRGRWPRSSNPRSRGPCDTGRRPFGSGTQPLTSEPVATEPSRIGELCHCQITVV